MQGTSKHDIEPNSSVLLSIRCWGIADELAWDNYHGNSSPTETTHVHVGRGLFLKLNDAGVRMHISDRLIVQNSSSICSLCLYRYSVIAMYVTCTCTPYFRPLFITLDPPDIRTACWPLAWLLCLYMCFAMLMVLHLDKLGNVLDGEGCCAVR